MSNTTEIKLPCGDLASRHSASVIRRQAECAFTEGASTITFDLSVVSSLSDSFADELFGVLLTRLGVEGFIRHVFVRASEDHIVLSIARALRNRVNDSSESAALASVSALVAARENQRCVLDAH